MIYYKDDKYGFFEIFNEKNGTLIRSDIDGVDPTCRSFPELLDIGIMGHCVNSKFCKNAGIDCYQKGYIKNTPHMSVSDFELIARQAAGKTFQIALGGAGDPNKHPYFEEILKICRYYRIVPNLTTSGYEISVKEMQSIKKYCGAVAVSWYSRLINGIEQNLKTIDAIEKLVTVGCVTNIHYVVSKETIDEAIYRLENNLFPKGISAVIFILYKPVGFGKKDKLLEDNAKLNKFLNLTSVEHPFRIGFDTCFTPAILRYCKSNIPISCIDSCEAGTFSMYVDSQMKAYPCSFGIDDTNCGLSLRKYSIREVWDSPTFNKCRIIKNDNCSKCDIKLYCHGGCKLGLDINLCI